MFEIQSLSPRSLERDYNRMFSGLVVMFEPNIRRGINRMRGLEAPEDVRQKMTLKIWELVEAHSADRGPMEGYIGRSLANFISSEFRRLRAPSRHVYQMTTTSIDEMKEHRSGHAERGSSRRKADGGHLVGGDEGGLCESIESYAVMADLDSLDLTEQESWYVHGALQGVPANEISAMLGVSHATQCRVRARLAAKLAEHLGYEIGERDVGERINGGYAQEGLATR